jgi:hypothetical protein
VTAAAVTESVVLVKLLPDHSSIFSAEARAIPLAPDPSSNLGMTDSWSFQFAVVPTSYKNRKLANMSIFELVSRVTKLMRVARK